MSARDTSPVRRNTSRLTQEEVDAIRRWVADHPTLSLRACVTFLRSIYPVHRSTLYLVLQGRRWRDPAYVPTHGRPMRAGKSIRFPAPKIQRGETRDEAQQRVIREYLASEALDRKVAS